MWIEYRRGSNADDFVSWTGSDLEYMMNIARNLLEGPNECRFYLRSVLRDSCVKRNDKVTGIPIQVSINGEGHLLVCILDEVDMSGVSGGATILSENGAAGCETYEEILDMTRLRLISILEIGEDDGR